MESGTNICIKKALLMDYLSITGLFCYVNLPIICSAGQIPSQILLHQ